MKMNWGWGIVIAIVCFIGFILFFVLQMSLNKNYDHQLVTDEYYKKELRFQNDLVKEKATVKEHMQVSFLLTDNGLELIFPEKIHSEEVKGFAFFYRPSDKDMDFQLPVKINDGKMLISKNQLHSGRWNIQINYVVNGKEYLSSEQITIK